MEEDNLNKVINKLLNDLNYNKIKCSLLLVGSAVSNKEFNDIDFLMAVDNKDIIIKKLKRVFKNYLIEELDDAIKIKNYTFKEISIAIYTKREINEIVDNFILGENIILNHRTWCLGYWVPESFINNIKNAKILIDEDSFFENINKRINKDLIYARKKILNDSLEEITIKNSMLELTNKNSIQYQLLKNDIFLALLRSFYVINNDYLVTFKKYDEQILQINNDNLNNYIFNETDNINKLVKIIRNHNCNNNLYLGTWQFSGDFKQLTEAEIKDLVTYAKHKGINKFDTALVYGNGKVEKILGNILDENDIVLTKIPAKIKPLLDDKRNLNLFYDFSYINECVLKSLKNLKRNVLDICLLHNFTYSWNNNPDIINFLLKLKEKGLVKKVGISLPNNYDNVISDEVLLAIDVIEVPFNSNNKWILKQLNRYKKFGIEIIFRSLFLQGKELKKPNDYIKILKNVQKHNVSLVIGMTTKEQIDKNTKLLKEVEE